MTISQIEYDSLKSMNQSLHNSNETLYNQVSNVNDKNRELQKQLEYLKLVLIKIKHRIELGNHFPECRKIINEALNSK